MYRRLGNSTQAYVVNFVILNSMMVCEVRFLNTIKVNPLYLKYKTMNPNVVCEVCFVMLVGENCFSFSRFL